MSANYIQIIADDIANRVSPNRLPDKGVQELFELYALLVLVKGSDVTDKDVHDAWSVWATEYDPNNESLRPFAELDEETRAQDSRFTVAIKEVAQHLAANESH